MNERRIDGVIVDAGHGGIDSGAVGNNLLEKDLTLEASLYMAERLQELGIPVILTRDGDTYLPKSERVRKILSITNSNPNTILVSNHINAGGGEGAEVVYSLKNDPTLANLVLDNIGEKGQLKRKAYQRRLPENPNKDYYYILRETGNTEPILVEYGFIDNGKDANKLRNNLKDYVEGVVKAIAEYTGYSYRPRDEEEEEAMDYYIVQKGDTLYSISRRVNIPVEEIKRINNLTSNTLSIGQKLYFVEEPIKDNIYIVQKGDTLYKIAKELETTVDKLKEINNLTSNTLSVGQELIIPSIEEEEEEFIPGTEYDVYTIQKGDSLWAISRKYNISVPELIAINNLDTLTLQIGDQLLVPKTEEETYTVEKGDTLWSVAKKFDMDVNTLKELNNLVSNLLSIGQILRIK